MVSIQALSIVIHYWIRAENEIYRQRWDQKIHSVLLHKKQTMIFLAIYDAEREILEDEKEIQQFYRNLTSISRRYPGQPIWSLPCLICHRHITEIELDIDPENLMYRYVLYTRCQSTTCGMTTRNIII